MQAYCVEQSPSRERSLPYSPEPATCPCPESGQSSLHPIMLVIKIHFNIIFSFTRGSKLVFFIFPPQNPVVFLLTPVRATCPTHLVLGTCTQHGYLLSVVLTNHSISTFLYDMSVGPSVERKTVGVVYRDVIVGHFHRTAG